MPIKRTLLKLAYPFYTRIRAATEVIQALPDPVLVYQMSKVGSSTVQETLHEAGIPPLHVHFVDAEHWEKASDLYTEKNEPLPHHFHTGRLVRLWLNCASRQVRVVTLVRDPIARYVSGAFEVGRLKGVPTGEFENALRVLREQLTEEGVLRYPYRWFDWEIKPVFGVDVLEHPFNREKGVGRIRQDHVDILILTLEQLSERIPTVLSDFVGAPLSLRKSRVRKEQTYVRVKRHLTLPEPTVRRLYDTEWMRHFYSPHHIERFVRRWSEATEREKG